MTTPTATEKAKDAKRGAGANRLVVENRRPASDGDVGAKTAKYWFGFRPVGQKPEDPSDPSSPMIDDPDACPYPPFFDRVIGGQTFLQYIDPVVHRDRQTGDVERRRQYGLVAELTEAQVRRIHDHMSRTWVRWHEREGKPPHAQPVVLPDPAHVKAADEEAKETRKPGMRVMSPIVASDDVPIANYVYFVKARDRGQEIPEPVSVTGIELP